MSFIDTLEFNFSNLEEEDEKVQKIVMGLPDIIRKKYFDDFLKGQKDPDTYVTLTWIIGVGIQHIYSKNYKLLFANIISTTFIIIQMIQLIYVVMPFPIQTMVQILMEYMIIGIPLTMEQV